MIHGGNTFDSKKDYISFLKNMEVDLDRYRKKKWGSQLRNELGDDHDVLLLKMPNPANAKYSEWKLVFDKVAPLLENNVILIGHSLGALFLIKYLSSNNFPKKIGAIMLVAPPYDDEDMEESLGDFKLPESLKKLEEQASKIFIYHSEDDEVVPYKHFKKYKNALPGSTFRGLKKRGHFNKPKFPEIIRDIRKI